MYKVTLFIDTHTIAVVGPELSEEFVANEVNAAVAEGRQARLVGTTESGKSVWCHFSVDREALLAWVVGELASDIVAVKGSPVKLTQ